MQKSLRSLRTIVRHEGADLFFDLDDEADEVQRYLLRGAFYEAGILDCHRSLIPKQGRVVDGGANIGNHSVFYAKVCGAERVLAVEPNPRALRLLRRNIALNGLSETVEVAPVGLGAGEGWGRLDQHEALHHNLGGVSIQPLSHMPPTNGVKIVAGDTLLGDGGVDFIKLDIEGGEMEALDGLKETIGRHAPVISVEIMDKNRSHFSAWLEQNRYRIERSFIMYRNIINFICLKT